MRVGWIARTRAGRNHTREEWGEKRKRKKKGDSIRQGGFLSMVMKQGDNNIYVPRPALRDLEIGSPQIYPLLEEQRTESKKKRIEKNEK